MGLVTETIEHTERIIGGKALDVTITRRVGLCEYTDIDANTHAHVDRPTEIPMSTCGIGPPKYALQHTAVCPQGYLSRLIAVYLYMWIIQRTYMNQFIDKLNSHMGHWPHRNTFVSVHNHSLTYSPYLVDFSGR